MYSKGSWKWTNWIKQMQTATTPTLLGLQNNFCGRQSVLGVRLNLGTACEIFIFFSKKKGYRIRFRLKISVYCENSVCVALLATVNAVCACVSTWVSIHGWRLCYICVNKVDFFLKKCFYCAISSYVYNVSIGCFPPIVVHTIVVW